MKNEDIISPYVEIRKTTLGENIYLPLDFDLKEVNEMMEMARKDEAISFMLFNKYYIAYRQSVGGTQYWVSIDGRSVLTTEQLYEKFKKENEQNNS